MLTDPPFGATPSASTGSTSARMANNEIKAEGTSCHPGMESRVRSHVFAQEQRLLANERLLIWQLDWSSFTESYTDRFSAISNGSVWQSSVVRSLPHYLELEVA